MKKANTIVLGLMLLSVSGIAQNASTEQLRLSGANFYQICQHADSVFAEEKNVLANAPRNKFSDGEYVQYQRWKWYWHTRVDENGNFPSVNEAFLRQDNNPPQVQSAWTNISQTACDGGYNGMGRATCVAFDPVNSSVMYVGAPIGGLWKTTDGGLTYAPLTDALPYVSVGSCVVDPLNGNTIYISVGDHSGWWNYSRGVYKSTDGGVTWNPTGLNWQLSQGRAIAKVEMDPLNNQILYAATTNGLYKTSNAGTNWSVVRSGDYSDIEFEPGTSNIYVAHYDYWGTSEVYRSTDGGTTWNALTSFGLNYNKLKLAVTPAAPAMLAITSSLGNKPLYVSHNYGATNAYVSDCPEGGVIFISPTDSNVFYNGFMYVHKSTDGGVNWTTETWWYQNPPYATVHADQRNVAFHPLRPDTLYFCNDGGLYSYSEGMNDWTELTDGFVTTQFYKMAHSQTDPMMIIGGTQDNGGRLRLSNGLWRATNGGDAMEVAIDPTDDDIIYTTYVNGKLYRSMDRWVNDTYYCISDNIPGGTPNGSWVAPYMLDPTDEQTLVAGYDDVWRTTDRGATWSALSSSIFNGSNIECLMVATSDPNIIWISSDTSLKMTSNMGSSWNQMNNPGNIGITSITVNPTNSNEIWLTFGQYTANTKVYYSNNGGMSWTNWSSGLPNVAVNCALYEQGSNDKIYVGTDAGVYVRDSLNTTWTLVGSGLPNTSVTDLEIYYNTGKLRAATHGRGIWETDITLTNAITEPSLSVDLAINVVPNPSADSREAVITSETLAKIDLQICNMLGEIVWTSSLIPQGNISRVQLPVLAPGQYVLTGIQDVAVMRTSFIVQ
jgi:photosystem II stability/assembly factor-like uncharacterized protein